MKTFTVTDDIKCRASLGQLTNEERQQMRDEMHWYRQHLMHPRKILVDLLLENTRVKVRELL